MREMRRAEVKKNKQTNSKTFDSLAPLALLIDSQVRLRSLRGKRVLRIAAVARCQTCALCGCRRGGGR